MVAPLYERFGNYECPADLWVCEQCGPEWSSADIRGAPLRSLSLLQLEAVHVMSLADNDFRYFFPRLIELLLLQDSPVFAFSLAQLKGRTPGWQPAENDGVRRLVDDLWRALLERFPADLGYFSDAPTLIDFTYWCDIPLRPHLDRWRALKTDAAAAHLADLADYLGMMREPVDPAVKDEVLDWLAQR
jgi:hypothetical protein